jgi:hypothetical protein
MFSGTAEQEHPLEEKDELSNIFCKFREISIRKITP